ncbi:hypothetical protein BCR44DRAFT_38922 [Catenaria anguillulae PL171]|uniref:DUF4470 domain-containing protein n=1 Tax=Catenaria anguillulae PL171 TaxID=765915 RepID=A0A1Y2I4U9_9FUNG|nr:hypothetical protein BCR44DRAFT_38922 [Catenaria anguillulae PL171]
MAGKSSKGKAKKSQTKQPKATTATTPPQGSGSVDRDEASALTPSSQRTLPCTTVVRDESAGIYQPFGNVFPEDVFLHLNVFASPCRLASIDALLVGEHSGASDLRHVLHTIAELKRKLSPSDSNSHAGAIMTKHFERIARRSESTLPPLPLNVNVYINDHQPEVIARNILILHAIATCADVPTPGLVCAIAQFWYSIALDPPVTEFWQAQIQACLGRSDEEWMSPTSPLPHLRVADAASLKQLKQTWFAWLACTWTLPQLCRERDALMLASPSNPKSMLEYATHVTQHFAATLAMFGQSNQAQIAKVKAEVEQLVQHGRWFNEAGLDRLKVNPSMLVARADGSCAFRVHHGAVPADGHVFDMTQKGGVNVEKDMLVTLSVWIESLHSLVEHSDPDSPSATVSATLRPIHLHFTFNIDHPLSYMESLTLTSTRFDVIHTASTADHCGLLNILVHASPLLKPIPSRSLPHTPHLLTTTTMPGSHGQSRDEFVKEALVVDMHDVPILLGLQLLQVTDSDQVGWGSLVDPFAWSEEHVRMLGRRIVSRFTWLACPVPSAPVRLDESPGIVDALVKITAECCGSHLTRSVRAVGGSMTTGALLGTLLANALASNRISWTDPSPAKKSSRLSTHFPIFQVPAGFWARLTSGTALRFTISDVLIHAQMHGLSMPTTQDFALHVTATFPLDVDLSSNLIVCMTFVTRQYCTEAIQVVGIDHQRKTITVAFYLPGIVDEWDAKLIRVSLLRPHTTPSRRSGEKEEVHYAPMGGKVWTLNQLDTQRVTVQASPWVPVTRSIAEATAAVIEARKATEEEGEAKLLKVVDAGKKLKVVVDVKAYGCKVDVALPTREQLEAGRGAALVSINSQLHTFWLPCRVLVESAKYMPKSRTVELLLAKQVHLFVPKAGLLGLPYHQRLHRFATLPLTSLSPSELKQQLGFAFTHAEEQCRQDPSKMLRLGGMARVLALTVKDLLDKIIAAARQGHKSVLLTRKSDDSPRAEPPGFLGIILIHGVYSHPPTCTGKAKTLALDVTLTVFPPPTCWEGVQNSSVYVDAIQEVMDVVVGAGGPMFTVQGTAQAEAVVDMLKLAKVQCGLRCELPYPLIEGKLEGLSVAARRYFQRAILTPLAPADNFVREVYVAPQYKSAEHEELARTMGVGPRIMVPNGPSDQPSAPGQKPKVGSFVSKMLRKLAEETGQDPQKLLEQMGLGAFDL